VTTLALSIVIPTRNRRALLLETLASLREQTAAPGSYEIIVVADGPDDGTPGAVAALAATPPWAGRALGCLEQPWSGAAAARNRGLHAAGAPTVLFLHDDIQATPGLVAAHLARQAAAAPDGAVVLGRLEPEPGAGVLHRQLDGWWREHYRKLDAKAATWTDLYTGNVALPRAAALAAGGLAGDLDYGEDVEFGWRLQQAGLRFVYAPEALARARQPKPGAALLRDFYRSGRGSIRIFQRHPATLSALPLSAYGETNIRLRLVRGLLLRAGRRPGAGALIDAGFRRWAESEIERAARPLFELARAYYYWQGVRAGTRGRREWQRLTSAGVPILLYHSVERRPGRPPERYTVEERTFARHLALIRRLGYRVLPLATLVALWNAGRLPPPRTVAITFDDGYRNNLSCAWPLLRRAGYPATLFLATGSVGAISSWDPAKGETPRPFITWDEARALDRGGFRVEAHSVSHPDLTAVGAAEAARQLRESRATLQAELGRPVRIFAYPYGRMNRAVAALAEAAGYASAFSVQAGLNTLRTGRFDRKRVEIRGDEGLLRFVLKLWAGEDPLRYLPGRRPAPPA